ncbi:MAG: multiheme c-type cytochrome [Acidobacteriota bacterium]
MKSGRIKLAAAILAVAAIIFLFRSEAETSQRLDPSAWGETHAGRPRPQFAGGDQCLFCHRTTVGTVWQKDAHFLSIRDRFQQLRTDPEIERLATRYKNFARDAGFVMGGRRATRFLRRGDEGSFEILSVTLTRDQSGRESFSKEKPRWDREKFAARCVGCHMTAVDPRTLTAFETFVGCETCHGPFDEDHTTGATPMRFAKKAKDTPAMIASACGQCHLRGGRSRSTGRPFANNFISGDNLFKDFEFDLASIDPNLNPIDLHIQQNIRDIALLGKTDLTCLSCHRMHPATSEIHRRRLRSDYCLICHKAEPFKERKPYEVHSRVCEY